MNDATSEPSEEGNEAIDFESKEFQEDRRNFIDALNAIVKAEDEDADVTQEGQVDAHTSATGWFMHMRSHVDLAYDLYQEGKFDEADEQLLELYEEVACLGETLRLIVHDGTTPEPVVPKYDFGTVAVYVHLERRMRQQHQAELNEAMAKLQAAGIIPTIQVSLEDDDRPVPGQYL